MSFLTAHQQRCKGRKRTGAKGRQKIPTVCCRENKPKDDIGTSLQYRRRSLAERDQGERNTSSTAHAATTSVYACRQLSQWRKLPLRYL